MFLESTLLVKLDDVDFSHGICRYHVLTMSPPSCHFPLHHTNHIQRTPTILPKEHQGNVRQVFMSSVHCDKVHVFMGRFGGGGVGVLGVQFPPPRSSPSIGISMYMGAVKVQELCCVYYWCLRFTSDLIRFMKLCGFRSDACALC